MASESFIETFGKRSQAFASITTDTHVRIQQLTVLYKQSGTAIVGTLIAACAIFYLLWDEINHTRLFVWTASILFCVSLAVAWLFSFRRFHIFPKHIRKLDWGFSLQALLHGLCWGALGVMAHGDVTEFVFMAIIIALVGMATGAITTTAAVYRSYLFFLLPSLLPVSITMVFYDDTRAWNVAGVLIWAYIAILIVAGYDFFNTLKNTFNLRTINSELVENLMAEKIKSDKAVQMLETEIKERQSAQESMREAMESARDANIAKSRFLANMSHEIRTPLASIIGFAEMILEEPDPVEREASVKTIIRSGKHLLEVINDILDLSKIESEKLEIETIDVSIIDITTEITDNFQKLAEEKGVEFGISYDFPLPAKFCSDPTRVRQIIYNLASNALKFTQEGKIHLHVAYDRVQRKIRVETTDTGIGMSAAEQAKLFQPFTQADVSTTRQFGGTGLGLSISRRLALILGGDLACTSEKGKGSVFTLTLDTGEIDETDLVYETKKRAAANIVAGTPSLKGRVLLVEDSPDIQRLVSMLLRKTGVEVVCADNGREGVEKALTEDFDLVLMDIQMPVMDGVEAAKTLRATGTEMPIIAMTANVFEEERRAYQAAGMNDHVSKPIDKSTFYSSITRFLEEGEMNHVAADDQDEFNAMVEKFKLRLRTYLEEMSVCLKQNNIQDLALKSHTIKGLGGSFGFPEVTTLAADLNQYAKQGDLSKMETALSKLRDYAFQNVF
ncbi:MAG: response regulator [Gammaproteobacteria bacterium]|nr:response regulator [Gammaproteobacteria bacterium]